VSQRAHQAMERGRVRSSRSGKFVGAFGFFRQVIGQTQFGCDINDL
jgi:hypothetical protein